MSSFRAPFLAVAIGLIVAGPAAAQSPVSIPGTETHQMRSTTNGVEYRIDVALPAGYATSGTRYPVFYILDSNLAFSIATMTYRGFRLEKSVPEIIIVGIGYPGDDPAPYTPEYHASRSRDYTPTNVEATLPGSGGAGPFLRFIKAELIPMIDARYRTDPADRALGGHSLGGLFTAYALLNDPTIFKRYWIGSPSLWWDKEKIQTTVPAARARAEPAKGRALLTVGANEGPIMVPPMQRMAAALRLGFPGLTIGSVVFPDESHVSVLGASISRALRFLYARTAVAIGAADLAAYSGRWKSSTGETAAIAARAGKLMVTMGIMGNPPSTEEYLAESRDHLYGKLRPST
jgi:predicted alpha/beta superfamily hydrolase